jgi:protein-tyrosine phosphatase
VSRPIALEGPVNFRDLGGYENRGGRRVRTRRVYRSDSLSYMTDADVRHCVDELGIRSVVDLRAGHEVDEFSHGPLEATGVTFFHRPVVDETRREHLARDAAQPDPDLLSLDAIYLMMLERFADRIVGVLRLVADPAHQPVVFHCAAGKDRTGLVAALVLALLDVDDETVAGDYALTAEFMPLLVERHRAEAAARGLPVAEVDRQHFDADASAMHTVLVGLRARHGSIEGYVAAHGLGPDVIATLRASLLD